MTQDDSLQAENQATEKDESRKGTPQSAESGDPPRRPTFILTILALSFIATALVSAVFRSEILEFYYFETYLNSASISDTEFTINVHSLLDKSEPAQRACVRFALSSRKPIDRRHIILFALKNIPTLTTVSALNLQGFEAGLGTRTPTKSTMSLSGVDRSKIRTEVHQSLISRLLLYSECQREQHKLGRSAANGALTLPVPQQVQDDFQLLRECALNRTPTPTAPQYSGRLLQLSRPPQLTKTDAEKQNIKFSYCRFRWTEDFNIIEHSMDFDLSSVQQIVPEYCVSSWPVIYSRNRLKQSAEAIDPGIMPKLFKEDSLDNEQDTGDTGSPRLSTPRFLEGVLIPTVDVFLVSGPSNPKVSYRHKLCLALIEIAAKLDIETYQQTLQDIVDSELVDQKLIELLSSSYESQRLTKTKYFIALLRFNFENLNIYRYPTKRNKISIGELLEDLALPSLAGNSHETAIAMLYARANDLRLPEEIILAKTAKGSKSLSLAQRQLLFRSQPTAAHLNDFFEELLKSNSEQGQKSGTRSNGKTLSDMALEFVLTDVILEHSIYRHEQQCEVLLNVLQNQADKLSEAQRELIHWNLLHCCIDRQRWHHDPWLKLMKAAIDYAVKRNEAGLTKNALIAIAMVKENESLFAKEIAQFETLRLQGELEQLYFTLFQSM